MTAIRLVVTFTALMLYSGNVSAAPVNTAKAEAVSHLATALATADPARITHAYRSMGAKARPAADLVEALVNRNGYELLESGDTEAAIRVFQLNTATFPLSGNAWDSLAEAMMIKGEYDSAIRYYRVAFDLDPDSGNAMEMIERMTSELQASR